jgi:uncharacterized SAM-binding protein YcdF (DUF218 family)
VSADTPSPTDEQRAVPGGGALIIDPAVVDESPDDVAAAPLAGSARHRRWWLWAVVAVFALGAIYYFVTLLQVWQVGRSDQARPVDAIVVMGAAQYDGRPSPQLQARLDHVVGLWNRGLAPLVVVTGGNQPGDRFTEASASAQYLADHGVDPEAILQEDEGRSSWASLASVATMLHERGLDRVLLVSDPYHSLRIRLMAQDLGLTAYVSPTRTSPVRGARAFGKELKEAAGVAVGRIIGFDRLLSLTG